jgi:hypothetical protein
LRSRCMILRSCRHLSALSNWIRNDQISFSAKHWWLVVFSTIFWYRSPLSANSMMMLNIHILYHRLLLV